MNASTGVPVNSGRTGLPSPGGSAITRTASRTTVGDRGGDALRHGQDRPLRCDQRSVHRAGLQELRSRGLAVARGGGLAREDETQAAQRLGTAPRQALEQVLEKPRMAADRAT